MEKPLVSVVIPYYNMFSNVGEVAREFLLEAVNSVHNQTLQSYEIIIVDHKSTEKKSKDLLKEVAEHKKVKVVQCPQPYSLTVSRNYGILKHAKAEYICCLDADDRLDQNYLETLTKVLDGDLRKRLAFVTSYLKYFGMINFVAQYPQPDILRLMTENIAHTASVFRKSAFKKVGGYNTQLKGFPDWDLWLRFVSKGYVWEVVEKPLFFYRVREGSMVTKSNKIDTELYKLIIKDNQELYNKNMFDVLTKWRELYIAIIRRSDQTHDELQKANLKLSQQIEDLEKLKKENSTISTKTLGKLEHKLRKAVKKLI